MKIDREDLLAYVTEIGKLNDPEWMEVLEEVCQTDYSKWQLIRMMLSNLSHVWKGFKLGFRR